MPSEQQNNLEVISEIQTIPYNWKEKFVKLMGQIELSGYQATGLVMVEESGKTTTLKLDVNATKFFEMEKVQEQLEKDIFTAIGHCRFPTKGVQTEMDNNHPFTHGNTTIVHQGVLYNDEEINKKYGFTPKGETDSWAIVHLIEHYRAQGQSMVDAISSTHAELKGSWTVVAIDRLDSDKLYIFCHNKTFHINYYPEEEMFMFSTDKFRLDSHDTDVQHHFGYFEELRKLRVSSIKLDDEDCVVLGGEEIVKWWRLPEPQKPSWFGGKKEDFDYGDDLEQDKHTKIWSFKSKNKKNHKVGYGGSKNQTTSLLPVKT